MFSPSLCLYLFFCSHSALKTGRWGEFATLVWPLGWVWLKMFVFVFLSGPSTKPANCPGCNPVCGHRAGRQDRLQNPHDPECKRSSKENGCMNGWIISIIITIKWFKNSMQMYFSHEERVHKQGHSAKCVEIGWCHSLMVLVKGTSAGSLEGLSSLKHKSRMGKESPLLLASCGPSTGCLLCALTVSHIS